MRLRQGATHHGEAHGKAIRSYDWVAPAGTDPAAIPAMLEAAAPGLKLYNRGDGEVNGYVTTATFPGGAVWVCVHLYDFECLGHCTKGGEGPIKLRKAPALNAMRLTALKDALGEHATHKLAGDPESDRATLKRLGFRDGDPALT